MCGRFDTTNLTWADIYAQLSSFGQVKTAPLNLEPNADVRPTTAQVVARMDADGWTLDRMRWGLVPYWHNGKPLRDTAKGAGDGFKLTTFNARVETVATSSTFKAAYAKRRCIVPASGWYEWTGAEGHKIKHRFARTDGQPIWFAGLWDRVQTTDVGEVTSFTILTGPADGWLADYHDRTPVILDPGDWGEWLNPEANHGGLLSAVRPERFSVDQAD